MVGFEEEFAIAEKYMKDAHTCIGRQMFEAASVQVKDAVAYAARALILKQGMKNPKTQNELFESFNKLIVEEGIIQAEYGDMLKDILTAISVVPETKKIIKKADVFISRVKDILIP